MDKVHFIGIGGIGMSGLAHMALERGMLVSGSDMASNILIEKLAQKGATLHKGHEALHVPDHAFVVYSTDIKKDNPELLEAQRKGMTLLHRSQFLAHLMKEKKALLVTGTHGKTTTATLLAHTLMVAGLDPCFALGGMSMNYGTNARFSSSEYFVAEADESDSSHLEYMPEAAIVTNIDNDHIAHYGSIENIEKAIHLFLDKVSHADYQIYCKDDPRLRAGRKVGVSYGFHAEADLRILEWRPCEGGSRLFVHRRGQNKVVELFLPLFGRHNGMNGAAVFLLAQNLGIATPVIQKAFASFKGVKRRLERTCIHPEVHLFDDYAHHPTEVRATLQGLKAAYPGSRLIAFFQPHRPSRMKHVLSSFTSAFLEADIVVLTDLYVGSEPADPSCTNESIHAFIQKAHPKIPVRHIARNDALSFLYDCMRHHDVVVCMGAGDSTKIAHELGSLIETQGLRAAQV